MEDYQRLLKIIKDFHRDYQRLSEDFQRLSKTFEDSRRLSKTFEDFQRLPKTIKDYQRHFLRIFKTCWDTLYYGIYLQAKTQNGIGELVHGHALENAMGLKTFRIT